MSEFQSLLTGGHPNSLGNTVQVVEIVLSDPQRLSELFECYSSDDEVVRLRTSSALKRITKARIDLVIPHIDLLLNDISRINQPSTHWTMAELFHLLKSHMSQNQFEQAKEITKNYLTQSNDWIVLNRSIESLSLWTKEDAELKEWLIPKLESLTKDQRKSVANRATKWLNKLTA